MAVVGWPRTLRWSDFGTPVAVVPPGFGGTHTDCHIAIDVAFTHQGAVPVTAGGDYRLRDVRVTIGLDALNTWVLAGVPTGPRRATVLRHEQGHYDIAGIAARDADAALRALRDPDPAALMAAAQPAFDAIVTAGQTAEDTYDGPVVDNGTDHGNDPTQQAMWQVRIGRARSLADLP